MAKIERELVRLHVEAGLFSRREAADYVNGLTERQKLELLNAMSHLFTPGRVIRLNGTLCRARYVEGE